MEFALEISKGMIGKWKFEISVEFVEVPPEKEEAYWATIRFFAEMLKEQLTAANAELEAVNERSSGLLHEVSV